MRPTDSSRSRVTTLASALVVLVALLTAGSVVVRPQSARADDVAQAQARVDALHSLVATTTASLTEGTRRWEADQATLRQVQLRLKNTRRHAAAAQLAAEQGQQQVNTMVRNLYISGGQDSAWLLSVQSPDAFLGAVHGMQLAERATGSREAIVARAATARHRLREQEAEVQGLANEAQRLVDASAKRLAGLKALARDTSDKLLAAQAALQQALTRRAAAEAAVRARAAAARASRLRATASGAGCTGKPTSGQQNGNLDPASLCPLWQAPGHRLRADAAAAFNKMSKFHAATVGRPLCVTDSYRSYSEQVDLYERKPGLAAVPGTSNHGWGQAVDFCGGVEDTGSAAYRWMEQNAGRFGWVHPEWARPSGSKPEPWHWEYGT